MRSPKLLLLTILVCLAAPAAASADFGHVIAPGESLSSVAAADGLSVDQLAAANGIASGSELTAGATLQIPPQSAASVASAPTPAAEQSPAGAPTESPVASDAAGGSPASGGGDGYTVQPGDTLSAIAAQYGTTVDQLAAANGLDPAGLLPAGATLSIGGSSAPASSSSSSTAETVSTAPAGTAAGGAQPTPESVTAQDVGQVAADNGVSPSLAEAVGDQESGFNNSLVSSTGATGVMQIEPGTWNYIDSNLATPPPLSPSSAQDNIRGGVLLLRSLLNQTGGDPSLAAAGYYQGLQSVRQHGMYADTQQYVNDVMALRQRFGGG